jgi:predicted ATPase
MESWLQLQLEPTALRQPSDFNATPSLKPNGENLPATLDRIARTSGDPEAIYAQIANRLAELIKDVRSVTVDRDKKLELLTLILTDRDHTSHPARSLSDGTLRFLALSVLELDPAAHGVLCLEEPENGIHPDRITTMLRLLQDIAMDVNLPLAADNPLRQVIINTHSPLVVGECPDDALVLARGVQAFSDGRSFDKITFSGLSKTWRERYSYNPVSRGQLLAYLEPSCLLAGRAGSTAGAERVISFRRIRDRADLMPGQTTIDFGEGAES